MRQVAEAVESGVLGGRLWLYANYDCNLTCAYCLTESGPRAARRRLAPERMLELADRAAELGFTTLGVTGGEPFLVAGLATTLVAMSRRLPVVVLSNGSLLDRRRVAEVAAAGDRLAVQLSLDSADPADNDRLRGPRAFATTLRAVTRLRSAGVRVRIATTAEEVAPAALARLCELHRSLGIADADHVVRPVVRRGRAIDRGLGRPAVLEELPAELTITAEGAFWSPFGPTVRGGRLDTDLLITRTTRPLSLPVAAMLRLAARVPGGRSDLIC